MTPRNSPIREYRDRAAYMREYRRSRGGSTRDYTLVYCYCGKQVYRYDLSRHQTSERHPSPPPQDYARIAQIELAEEGRIKWIQEGRDTTVRQINEQVFIEAGESASSSDLTCLWSSFYDLKTLNKDDLGWTAWAETFFARQVLGPYFQCGQGMVQYMKHIKRMEEDHKYERRIERARRRFQRAKKGIRGRTARTAVRGSKR
jgi:hypothetical protein